MNYSRILLFLLLLATATTHAQGVNFEEKLSWPKILAKAKSEDKYIFVDFFTTWCGPCRAMRAMLLTQPAAASYFNDKFICVSIQLDTTANDDPDGHPLHRIVELANDYVMRFLRTPEGPNWNFIHDLVAEKYPNQADEVVDFGKITYFEQKQQWPEFQDAVDTYITRYGDHAIPEYLSNYALEVFKNCPDEKCNLEALAWSKRAVAGVNAKHQYQETLDKMQRGEKLEK